MLPSLPQRNARCHETNRSFLLALKGYQDGVNHNAGYAQWRAVPAWVSIAENWVVFITGHTDLGAADKLPCGSRKGRTRR
jgi:hypothetical protein